MKRFATENGRLSQLWKPQMQLATVSDLYFKSLKNQYESNSVASKLFEWTYKDLLHITITGIFYYTNYKCLIPG